MIELLLTTYFNLLKRPQGEGDLNAPMLYNPTSVKERDEVNSAFAIAHAKRQNMESANYCVDNITDPALKARTQAKISKYK